MKLDYYYRETTKIKEYFEKLEVLRRVFDLLPPLPHIEENLRRESLLKSSLFSARIEGNRLKLEDISYASLQRATKDIEKIEVANILKALNWLNSGKTPKKLSFKLICKLHQFVLSGLSPDAGHLRHEPSAIFNQAGIAIYVPPPQNEIPNLIKKLIKITDSSKEKAPAKAAISHFIFEKIHPFLDGNGRVGRLLSTFILKNSGFDYRGLVSLEEYLETKRQTYYDLLAINQKDITDFVEFFLEGLVTRAEKSLSRLKDI
jgi:Fic family protein